MTFSSIKNWIRKYPFAFGLLLLCLLGFIGIVGKIAFLLIGVGYAVFHLDGFWDYLKRTLGILE